MDKDFILDNVNRIEDSGQYLLHESPNKNDKWFKDTVEGIFEHVRNIRLNLNGIPEQKERIIQLFYDDQPYGWIKTDCPSDVIVGIVDDSYDNPKYKRSFGLIELVKEINESGYKAEGTYIERFDL